MRSRFLSIRLLAFSDNDDDVEYFANMAESSLVLVVVDSAEPGDDCG